MGSIFTTPTQAILRSYQNGIKLHRLWDKGISQRSKHLQTTELASVSENNWYHKEISLASTPERSISKVRGVSY